jgi:carbon-monoxide dehydrogenase small subunit
MELSFTVNGRATTVDCAPGATLFEVLRTLGLRSVKRGCDDEGTCGTCSVLLDGKLLLSCITPAPRAAGREVTTVEGLGDPSSPHPLQRAFVDTGAVQCGYCTPGMVLAAKALLDENPAPAEADIRDALSSNLCRCTGYVKIVEAVSLAADRMRKTSDRDRPRARAKTVIKKARSKERV